MHSQTEGGKGEAWRASALFECKSPGGQVSGYYGCTKAGSEGDNGQQRKCSLPIAAAELGRRSRRVPGSEDRGQFVGTSVLS